jgi:hypothetical protein
MVGLKYLIPMLETYLEMEGTCILIEVETLNDLINYFQVLYRNFNVLFELKGIHTAEMK